MRTPWQVAKSLFAALRGEDPQREMRWIPPFPIAGIRLTADESLSLSTVWACIDIIAKSVASCDWQIYEPDPKNPKRRRLLHDDWKTWMLNTRPNPEMTAIGFREAMLFQAIPFGNSYAEIVRDAGSKVNALWPLQTDRVMPRRDPKTWELVYHYTQPDGSITVFPQNRIYHVRGPGLWGLMGDSIIARAARTLGVAAAQERFSASFFGQGAQLAGVLKTNGKLDAETHKRLKEDWAEKYKGPDNAHKPLILEGGMDYTSISTDPQKAQLTEGKKFTVEEICRWFGVPPHKVQHLEHATFSNIEHSSIEFVRDACRPWAVRLCQEATYKFFDQKRGPWKYTTIDLSPLTRGDALSRAQAQASWRQNGIKTANEIRADEGLDDCGDDGDVLLVPMNLTTVEKILTAEEPSDTTSKLNPNIEPDDNEDEDIEIEDEAISVKRHAVIAALKSALNRYGRRLNNRRESLKNKKDAEASLNVFRKEQHEVIVNELSFFNEFTVSLFGRELNVEDMAKVSAMYERGETVTSFIRSLPTHAVHNHQ